MASKEVRMLMKVIKDSSRDKSREVCIIASPDGNIYRQYALLRKFADSAMSEGEYLVELNYEKNFNSEKPVKFNVLTPNGIFEIGQNICLAQGTFHRGSSDFQNNRIIVGYGLIRQLWAIIQYVFAYEPEEKDKPRICKNYTDDGLSGIGWVSASKRDPEEAKKLAAESKAFNAAFHAQLVRTIYEQFSL